MPITLPRDLPAFDILKEEGVMVMSDARAAKQDIRPMRIGLLNLMPKKIQTETQFSRLIGATPLQTNLSLIKMSDHTSKTASADHMDEFYQPFSEIRDQKFDGLIITGAPIEHLPFEDVTYWQELRQVMDWTQTNVHSTFGVCWGGMAMINHFHGVQKHMMDHKAFGCYRHDNLIPNSPYLRGFSDDCVIPVSRWTEMQAAEIDAASDLRTLLGSEEVGPCLVEDPAHRALYIFNHFEYESGTLGEEYGRDLMENPRTDPPINYYPEDNPANQPQNRWRSHAHLLYSNWISEIYLTTPYDLHQIGTQSTDLRG